MLYVSCVPGRRLSLPDTWHDTNTSHSDKDLGSFINDSSEHLALTHHCTSDLNRLEAKRRCTLQSIMPWLSAHQVKWEGRGRVANTRRNRPESCARERERERLVGCRARTVPPHSLMVAGAPRRTRTDATMTLFPSVPHATPACNYVLSLLLSGFFKDEAPCTSHARPCPSASQSRPHPSCLGHDERRCGSELGRGP